MKKVMFFLALTTMLTVTATAQRSKGDWTPVYNTPGFQKVEDTMNHAGVYKWLAWGTGDIVDQQRFFDQQGHNTKVMATKEFDKGVLPNEEKDMVMLKADAFNLAEMNNHYHFFIIDSTLSKEKANLFLFSHGFYAAVYDDVKEAYYFYYYPHPLISKNDPILKKGCRVFWIDWTLIKK